MPVCGFKKRTVLYIFDWQWISEWVHFFMSSDLSVIQEINEPKGIKMNVLMCFRNVTELIVQTLMFYNVI